MKQMLRDELGADARAAAATGPTAAERHAEEAQCKGRGRARWCSRRDRDHEPRRGGRGGRRRRAAGRAGNGR